MATVNVSVPDEIKDAFNAEFEGQNIRVPSSPTSCASP